jgi:hypothetical protein
MSIFIRLSGQRLNTEYTGSLIGCTVAKSGQDLLIERHLYLQCIVMIFDQSQRFVGGGDKATLSNTAKQDSTSSSKQGDGEDTNGSGSSDALMKKQSKTRKAVAPCKPEDRSKWVRGRLVDGDMIYQDETVGAVGHCLPISEAIRPKGGIIGRTARFEGGRKNIALSPGPQYYSPLPPSGPAYGFAPKYKGASNTSSIKSNRDSWRGSSNTVTPGPCTYDTAMSDKLTKVSEPAIRFATTRRFQERMVKQQNNSDDEYINMKPAFAQLLSKSHLRENMGHFSPGPIYFPQYDNGRREGSYVMTKGHDNLEDKPFDIKHRSGWLHCKIEKQGNIEKMSYTLMHSHGPGPAGYLIEAPLIKRSFNTLTVKRNDVARESDAEAVEAEGGAPKEEAPPVKRRHKPPKFCKSLAETSRPMKLQNSKANDLWSPSAKW